MTSIGLPDGRSVDVTFDTDADLNAFMSKGADSLSDMLDALDGPDRLKTPEQAVDFIKENEEFRAVPYDDAGSLSVGYGTKFPGLTEGDVVTEAQAEALLRDHIDNNITPWIRKNVHRTLQPHELAALTSLAYNTGTAELEGTRALKALNEGDLDTFSREAFDPVRGFTKTQGRVSPGLVGRRRNERQLFFNQRPAREATQADSREQVLPQS
jgi:GH24 family phage-related lysozyme (muramidase)